MLEKDHKYPPNPEQSFELPETIVHGNLFTSSTFRLTLTDFQHLKINRDAVASYRDDQNILLRFLKARDMDVAKGRKRRVHQCLLS